MENFIRKDRENIDWDKVEKVRKCYPEFAFSEAWEVFNGWETLDAITLHLIWGYRLPKKEVLYWRGVIKEIVWNLENTVLINSGEAGLNKFEFEEVKTEE